MTVLQIYKTREQLVCHIVAPVTISQLSDWYCK